MFKRKVLLSNGTHGIVQSVYEVEDSGTKIPSESIESETLNSGDELKEDGTVIKYVPPTPPEPPKPQPTLESRLNELELNSLMQEVKIELLNDVITTGGVS